MVEDAARVCTLSLHDALPIFTGGSEVEILSAIDNSSTMAMNLTGNEFANQLWGTNGANVLNRKGARQNTSHSPGADVDYFDNTKDSVFEDAGRGSDDVYASLS